MASQQIRSTALQRCFTRLIIPHTWRFSQKEYSALAVEFFWPIEYELSHPVSFMFINYK